MNAARHKQQQKELGATNVMSGSSMDRAWKEPFINDEEAMFWSIAENLSADNVGTTAARILIEGSWDPALLMYLAEVYSLNKAVRERCLDKLSAANTAGVDHLLFVMDWSTEPNTLGHAFNRLIGRTLNEASLQKLYALTASEFHQAQILEKATALGYSTSVVMSEMSEEEEVPSSDQADQLFAQLVA